MAEPKNTRAQIKKAAKKVFAEKGYHEATVRHICARAGSGNAAAINYHFGGKEKLYREVLEDLLAELERDMSALDLPPWEALTPVERLKTYIFGFCRMNYGRETTADPDHTAIIRREIARPGPHFSLLIDHLFRPDAQLLEHIVRAVLGPPASEDQVRDATSSIVGQLSYYVAFGSIFFEIHPDHPGWAEEHEKLAEHVYRFSLGGLEAMRRVLDGGETEPLDPKKERAR